MKVQVFRHVSFADIGYIPMLLNSWGCSVHHTYFYDANPQLPAMSDTDLLIVMGGPMSVNDEQRFSWLTAEKKFIREAIDKDIPVLGICLGAQLIASVLGANVESNDCAEIGWYPVTSVTNSPCSDIYLMPSEITTMHWHRETFHIPEGAVRLAQSQACANQAFQYGRRTIALQFHPEFTREIVKELLSNFGSDLKSGPYVQSAFELSTAPKAVYEPGHRLIESVLRYLMNS